LWKRSEGRPGAFGDERAKEACLGEAERRVGGSAPSPEEVGPLLSRTATSTAGRLQ
jgi:hypothetical protein